MPCRAPEEMKGDDIVAVEKSLESEAWAQLWTLRITHLQPGEPLAHGLTKWDVAVVAAWVKHLLDKWDHWPGGTFDCLSRDPALLRAPPSRLSCGWEGGALSGNPAAVQSCCSSHSRLLQPGQPGCLCVIHRVGVHAACF